MTAINMFAGQYLQLASTVNRASANWRLDFRIRQRAGATDRELFIAMQSAGDTFATRFKILGIADYFGVDIARVRLNDTDSPEIYEYGVRTLNDGAFHDMSLRCNGTTVTWYIDGTQRSTPSACTAVLNNVGAFGDRNAIAASDVNNDFDIEWIRIYDSIDTSALIHHWDAASSDTSNTGAQPILVDIIAANNATGVGFPTDGTAWVSSPTAADLAGAAAGQATATGALQGVGLEFTLRDIDSGSVKNAVTYARVDVHLASDLSLVKTFTNITTSPAGLMQLSDPLLETLGVNCFVVGWTSSGSDRFHANATVAVLS